MRINLCLIRHICHLKSDKESGVLRLAYKNFSGKLARFLYTLIRRSSFQLFYLFFIFCFATLHRTSCCSARMTLLSKLLLSRVLPGKNNIGGACAFSGTVPATFAGWMQEDDTDDGDECTRTVLHTCGRLASMRGGGAVLLTRKVNAPGRSGIIPPPLLTPDHSPTATTQRPPRERERGGGRRRSSSSSGSQRRFAVAPSSSCVHGTGGGGGDRETGKSLRDPLAAIFRALTAVVLRCRCLLQPAVGVSFPVVGSLSLSCA